MEESIYYYYTHLKGNGKSLYLIIEHGPYFGSSWFKYIKPTVL